MPKEIKETSAPVAFADTRFKSRTLIVNGKSHAVDKGRITTADADLIAYLDKHADFKRVTAAAE